MSKNLKILVFLLLGITFFFQVGTAEADTLCMFEDSFRDFPEPWWTIIAGDWTIVAGGLNASHDPSAWEYGAVSITHIGEGSYGLLTNTMVSFNDEVAGEIVVLLKVDPEFKGYAFSLDGDNNQLRLWKAKINTDGSMEILETLAVVDDVVFTAGQIYDLLFTYRDNLDLTGYFKYNSADEIQIHAQDTEFSDGGVAMAYSGSGTAHFRFMCIGDGFGVCFIQRALSALGPSPHIDLDTIRRLLPFLVLLGLVGIIYEVRARRSREF